MLIDFSGVVNVRVGGGASADMATIEPGKSKMDRIRTRLFKTVTRKQDELKIPTPPFGTRLKVPLTK